MARMSHDLEMSEIALKRSKEEMQTKLCKTNALKKDAERDAAILRDRLGERRNTQLSKDGWVAIFIFKLFFGHLIIINNVAHKICSWCHFARLEV